MSILNDYQVRFIISQAWGGKRLRTINQWLSCYIGDSYTLDRANELLDDVKAVLNGDYPLGGGQTQSLYYAHITQSETKIYKDWDVWEEDNNIPPDFTLPTAHFKVIVEAWRDYLAS